MEFWGVEVKSGEPLKVTPGDGMILHLSQACLGELKKEKANGPVCMFVNVDGKKFVLGTLFTGRLPQQQFDLVFDRDFELLHNWKAGSVYFYGYKASAPSEDELPQKEPDESDSEDIPLTIRNNEKSQIKAKQDKSVDAQKANVVKDEKSDAGKQKVKIVEPKKDVNPEEDEDSSDDLMSEDEEDDDSQDEDDTDGESGESEEETPKKKAVSSKKRAAGSAAKTPIQSKKVKVTAQKTEGKKVGGHVATPHPAKQAGKTPANKPKSGVSRSCKSCNKTFDSEKGLESHTKAKHG